MKRTMLCLLALTILLIGSFSEARVGGGRSFGSRGSRGFSPPSSTNNSPYRSYQAPSNPSPFQSQPSQTYANPLQTLQRPSVLHSLGAGLAGGFLGSMLFRSMGGGGIGSGYSGIPGVQSGAGVGPLEILLFAGLLFFLIKMFMNRSQTTSASSSSQGAANLMKQARQESWPETTNTTSAPIFRGTQPINPDIAMDLFFRVQGAWKNRNILPIENILDRDAKIYLDEEVSKLKINRRINCLENIAVRSTEIVESWEEAGKDYSTVRFTANLLDFTIDEQTEQVVEGNRTNPVKFEEYWTFSKETKEFQWKLSAIQQS